MDGCPPLDRLREEAAHLATCDECREKLAALELLEAPETPEEARVLDRLTANPRRVLAAARLRAGPEALRLRSRPRWIAAGAIAAAIAAAVVVAALRTARDPAKVLRDLQGSTRPLEVALSDVPYAPYQPQRGARSTDFDASLSKLLEAREGRRPGAERALAVFYLLRAEPGDAARVDQALAQAGDSAEAENDRGAAAFARGDLIAALEHFAKAGARFNEAVTLENLGLRERAAALYAALPQSQWTAEAGDRARRLRAPLPAPQPSRRREAYLALLAARTPEELAGAEAAAQDMPDLLALARKLSPSELPEHARLYVLYRSLRDRAMSGGDVREVEDFARLPRVQADPLLWAPALQLAAYVHGARGQWREVEKYDASIAGACRVRGCSTANEAIALDELADVAQRDGDYAAAERFQDRAEKLLLAAGDPLLLAELHRKRASLLDEQNRHDQAARAIVLALRELAPFAVDARGRAAFAVALEEAAAISERDQRHAEAELSAAAIDFARAAGDRDLEVDAEAHLATNAAARGEDARAQLRREIARLSEAGHSPFILLRLLAEAQLAHGDASGALATAEQGLAATPGREWTGVQLHLVHARALEALGRDPGDELSRTVDDVARDPGENPAEMLEETRDLVAELSRSAKTADDLAVPLDKLRAAALGVAPAGAGWSRALPKGTCVNVVVGGVQKTAGVDCTELWTLAADFRAAPRIVTSLSRLLAPEPRVKSALFVSAQTTGDIAAVATPLPGAEQEIAALRKLAAVTELSGERATPDMALRLAPRQDLLHFAVHGFEGGFLQLAGEGGRLAARDVAETKLPGARVVLSACESAAPGPRGISWAFARAGASVIAAAEGKIDDAAAARWSERFYAALGNGLTFSQAAREAEKDSPTARFIVVK
ncbi:MAG: CHAT domain-containing protein [Myxococcales bacterium]|nr:CHAT domain-containing protein [Myxococcales bacterium]